MRNSSFDGTTFSGSIRQKTFWKEFPDVVLEFDEVWLFRFSPKAVSCTLRNPMRKLFPCMVEEFSDWRVDCSIVNHSAARSYWSVYLIISGSLVQHLGKEGYCMKKILIVWFWIYIKYGLLDWIIMAKVRILILVLQLLLVLNVYGKGLCSYFLAVAVLGSCCTLFSDQGVVVPLLMKLAWSSVMQYLFQYEACHSF